jgi:hypothetical protein
LRRRVRRVRRERRRAHTAPGELGAPGSDDYDSDDYDSDDYDSEYGYVTEADNELNAITTGLSLFVSGFRREH